MLTKLTIRNFKRFEEVEIELGQAVVFVGPNNSGKTTALQALALWNVGIRRWNEKRKGKPSPEKRSGVTINRRDLISIPTQTCSGATSILSSTLYTGCEEVRLNSSSSICDIMNKWSLQAVVCRMIEPLGE